MFSVKEKQFIAEKVEEIILSLNHPEMPKEKPRFKLHVEGKQCWSWADIEPNWVYEDRSLSINLWSENAREFMKRKKKK